MESFRTQREEDKTKIEELTRENEELRKIMSDQLSLISELYTDKICVQRLTEKLKHEVDEIFKAAIKESRIRTTKPHVDKDLYDILLPMSVKSGKKIRPKTLPFSNEHKRNLAFPKKLSSLENLL